MSSSMSDLRVLLQTEVLRCPLCGQTVSKPVLLPCLHSACDHCLTKYATDNAASGLFNCMVCHAECAVPENGHNVLCDNKFLEYLEEFASCHDSKSKACDYCSSYDSQTVEATSRCIQCRDNLCDSCTGAHRRTKLTRSHKVVTFTEIQKGHYDAEIRENQNIMCTTHELEAIKYYCAKDDVLICRECKVSQHDKHDCQDIEEAAAKYRTQASGLLSKVDNKIPGLVEFSLFLKDYIGHLDETKEKLTEEIEKQAELLHSMIDEHKAGMLEQLTAAAKEEEQGTQQRKQKVDDVTTVLKSTTDFVGKLLQHGKGDEVLSIRDRVSARLIQLGHYQLEPMASKLNLYFSAGTATKGNLEGIFGKVDVFNVPLNDKGVKTIARTDSPVQNGAPVIGMPASPSPRNLINIGEGIEEVLCFESRGTSDKRDIWPTGVAVNGDGNIVVLDRDNKKVKMFHRSGKFIREFGQNGVQNLQCPYDLTVMDDGSMAVTDYEDEDVKIFSELGVYLKCIKASFKYPRGITTNQYGQLIVVDCHSHRLTVHDPDSGEVIREISGKSDDGCDLFTDPYYVTTNRAGNIIVTDWSSPNIKFFDAHGHYLAKYGTYGGGKDQVLQPYGVCTDSYGNIFVADNQNHRIHFLAPDGKFVKFLITKQHGLWHPMAVAMDNSGQLVVTEALGKVKVFKYM